MSNSITVSMKLSTLKAICEALSYGLECAEARRVYEKAEAEEWKKNAVPFTMDDGPFSDTDDVRSCWMLGEELRRTSNDRKLRAVYESTLDLLVDTAVKNSLADMQILF